MTETITHRPVSEIARDLQLAATQASHAISAGLSALAGEAGRRRVRYLNELDAAVAALEEAARLKPATIYPHVLTPSQRARIIRLMGEYGSARFWDAEAIIRRNPRNDRTTEASRKMNELLAKPLSKW